MPLEMCYLLLTLKTIRKRAQICDRFLNILPGPTYDFGSVTRIAFKYKLTGFRINVFQK